MVPKDGMRKTRRPVFILDVCGHERRMNSVPIAVWQIDSYTFRSGCRNWRVIFNILLCKADEKKVERPGYGCGECYVEAMREWWGGAEGMLARVLWGWSGPALRAAVDGEQIDGG